MVVEIDPNVSWIQKKDYDKFLPQVEAIEKATARAPMRAAAIKPLLDDKDNWHLMVATQDDLLVGHVLYSVTDGTVTIKTLQEHPDYKGQGVRERLFKTMVDKLSVSSQLTRLEYAVHVDDTDMLIRMRDIFGFKVRKDKPVVQDYFPHGGAAVMMEVDIAPKKEVKPTGLMVYDPAAAQKSAEDAPPPEPKRLREYATRGELVLALIPKMQELTGMHWEAVKPEAGELQPHAVSRFEKRDKDIQLRTVDAVGDPAKAMAALRAYFGRPEEKQFSSGVRRAVPVSFPTEWARSIHIEQGDPGQLAEHFSRVLILPFPGSARETSGGGRPV